MAIKTGSILEYYELQLASLEKLTTIPWTRLGLRLRCSLAIPLNLIHQAVPKNLSVTWSSSGRPAQSYRSHVLFWCVTFHFILLFGRRTTLFAGTILGDQAKSLRRECLAGRSTRDLRQRLPNLACLQARQASTANSIEFELNSPPWRSPKYASTLSPARSSSC